MNIADLEEYYGKPYNNAYYEIAVILEKFTLEWFANSVRDIRAFRIEDWSNLTKIVKKKATNQ